ncbi:MAG: hypothetical protein ACKVPJ_13455 [Chitinophagales bacterium]
MVAVVDGTSNYLFSFGGSSAASFAYPSNFKTSKINIPPPSFEFSTTEWMSWGDANDRPNKIKDETSKNAYALSLLHNHIIPSHYGKGPVPIKIDDKGNRVAFWNDELRRFWKICDIPRLQKQIVSDVEWMANYFPELVLDNAGKKIAYARRHSPWKSRWKKQNDNGESELLYISSDFPYMASASNVAEIQTLDYDLPLLDFTNRAHKPGDSFSLQTQLKETDREYYDEAPWHPLIDGWLPIANGYPSILKYMGLHAMHPKFHVQVDLEYFEKKAELEGAKKLTGELFKKYFEELKTTLNTYIAGIENAGKTIITPRGLLMKAGKERWEVKIEPIKSESDGAQYLNNYQANVEIVQGMGLHVSSTGRTKGGSEQGSGSSLFQSFAINMEMQHYKREKSLKWLEFVNEVNGFGADGFMYIDFPTLMSNPKTEDLPEQE